MLMEYSMQQMPPENVTMSSINKGSQKHKYKLNKYVNAPSLEELKRAIV